MGLLGKVSLLKTKGKKGLLSKSLKTLEKITSDSEKNKAAMAAGPGKPPSHIFSKITKLSLGIDSPAYLFQLIQDYVGFSKGGLFMVDKEEASWIPLASSGWRFHASIPFSRTLALMPELDTQSCRFLDRENIERITGFFPEGGLDRNRDMVLKAFYHEERLIGLLVFEATDRDCLGRIREVITSFAHRIVRSQHDYLISFPDSILESFPGLQEELAGIQDRLTEFALIKLSFEDVIQTMRKAISCISEAWLHHILSRVFAGLFSGICRAYEGTNSHLYLLIPIDMMLDEELSAHQSALSLQQHFRETEVPFRISYERIAPGEMQGVKS